MQAFTWNGHIVAAIIIYALYWMAMRTRMAKTVCAMALMLVCLWMVAIQISEHANDASMKSPRLAEQMVPYRQGWQDGKSAAVQAVGDLSGSICFYILSLSAVGITPVVPRRSKGG